ncbi:restriction endonuclease subunit S [Thermithiobacillus plumbiphilus]|uniref:Restriction endonuclease subunit S n=1 Tax=Thermithiobacillus plumbiphilus TaxID=1729899 RepID=A0ABU9DDZ8_9PROT
MREGWERKKIADLVQPLTTIDPRKEPNKCFTYIDVSSVSRDTHKIVEPSSVKGADAPSRARRLVRMGDVIFATIRPTLNRIAEVPSALDGAVCSTGYFVLRPKPGILSRFLFYSLLTADFSDAMAALQRGAAYPAVIDSDIKRHELIIPPLPEQKRIVAILDEAFAGIDTAVANTEKNLANASELFESYLNSVFSQRGEGWIEQSLSKFVNSISTGPFGSLLHKSDYVSEGAPLVNPINIVGEVIVPDGRKMVGNVTKERLQSYILKAGDVVIARRGEIGRCAVVSETQRGWVCGTGCFFIRPLEAVNPHFLAHLLREPLNKS